MMKKAYIKPEMEFELEDRDELLAGSPPHNNGGVGANDETISEKFDPDEEGTPNTAKGFGGFIFDID